MKVVCLEYICTSEKASVTCCRAVASVTSVVGWWRWSGGIGGGVFLLCSLASQTRSRLHHGASETFPADSVYTGADDGPSGGGRRSVGSYPGGCSVDPRWSAAGTGSSQHRCSGSCGSWSRDATGKVVAKLTLERMARDLEDSASSHFGEPCSCWYDSYASKHRRSRAQIYCANPSIWIDKCHNYFHLYNMCQFMWVTAASMHMEGNAAKWFQMYKLRHRRVFWPLFV